MNKSIEFNKKDLKKIWKNNKKYSQDSLEKSLLNLGFEEKKEGLLFSTFKNTQKFREMVGLLYSYDVIN